MFSEPTPAAAYCKSWGVAAPQGLGLGSAQIRVRIGLGPPACPACSSVRPPRFDFLSSLWYPFLLWISCQVLIFVIAPKDQVSYALACIPKPLNPTAQLTEHVPR